MAEHRPRARGTVRGRPGGHGDLTWAWSRRSTRSRWPSWGGCISPASAGPGMSGIARIMLARGVTVSGSDSAGLRAAGRAGRAGRARSRVGHAAAQRGRRRHAGGVVSAIRPDNPELVAARQRGLRVLHRAAALASVMLGRRGVAVAGTHGKTTTTSMITTVAPPLRRRPGLRDRRHPGRDRPGRRGRRAARCSSPRPTRATARSSCCRPEVAVVTCVEADHLDNYAVAGGDRGRVRRVRPAGSPPGGLLVPCADDPGARALAAAAAALPTCGCARYGEARRRRLPGQPVVAATA